MPIPPPLQSHTDEPTRTHISRRTLCVCKLRNDGEIEMENVSVSFPFSVPHVTVLKHAKMHTSVHMKIHVCSVPTPGEDRKSSQALSEKKEIKRNVMGVFADERRMSAGWARVSARPLSCMRPSAAEESLVRQSATGVLRKGNGLCASVSWKMCFPASNIRLFLWRRDGQDRAERFPAEYSHEKWRKETSTLSPPTHTHTHSNPFPGPSRVHVWCGESATRACTHHMCRLNGKQ